MVSHQANQFLCLTGLIFTADIVLKFNTALVTRKDSYTKGLVTDRWKIANRYLRTQFALDFLSTAPAYIEVSRAMPRADSEHLFCLNFRGHACRGPPHLDAWRSHANLPKLPRGAKWLAWHGSRLDEPVGTAWPTQALVIQITILAILST